MRHKLGDKARLLHISEAIIHIENFLTDIDFDNFNENKLVQSAVERHLEIIEEAVTTITDELKTKYSKVEWPSIKKFRNVIAHEYFGISTQIVWGVVFKEIPVLKQQIAEILIDLDNP